MEAGQDAETRPVLFEINSDENSDLESSESENSDGESSDLGNSDLDMIEIEDEHGSEDDSDVEDPHGSLENDTPIPFHNNELRDVYPDDNWKSNGTLIESGKYDSCFVCGLLVGHEGNLPFMHKHRVLYTIRNNWEAAHISGPAKMQRRSGQGPPSWRPLDAHRTWLPLDDHMMAALETTGSENWHQFTRDGFYSGHIAAHTLPKDFPRDTARHGPVWGYAVHDHCWKILVDTCGSLKNYAASRSALLQLCRSQLLSTTMGVVLDWGHSYGDCLGRVGSVCETAFSQPGRLESPLWEFHPNDRGFRHHHPSQMLPTLISDYCDPLCDGIVKSGSSKFLETSSHPPRSNEDPFQTLPPEICMMILELLDDWSDLENVRRASSYLADNSMLESLFRAKFSRGSKFQHLGGFMRQLIVTACHDHGPKKRPWETAFMIASDYENNLPMVQRRRIWELADYLGGLISQRLKAPVCHGVQTDWTVSLNNGHGEEEELDQYGISVDRRPDSWQLPHHKGLADRPAKPQHWCCKVHTNKPGFVMFSDGNLQWWEVYIFVGETNRIRVSFAQVLGKRYVSGFAFGHGEKETLLGYQHSEAIEQALPTSLVGFHLAIDSRGIRGIRPVSFEGPHDWMGDHKGIPQARLTGLESPCRCDGPFYAIMGRFDALKLDDLFLTFHTDRRIPMVNTKTIWHPEVPDPWVETRVSRHCHMTLTEKYETCFNCRQVCLFGGSRGERLPFLSSVTLWYEPMIDYADPGMRVWAFAFGYSNGWPSVMLGQVPDAHTKQLNTGLPLHVESMSVAVDGSGGERITAFYAYHDYHLEGSAESYQMKTNRGKTHELPPNDDLPEGAVPHLEHYKLAGWFLDDDDVSDGASSDSSELENIEVLGLSALFDPEDGLKYLGIMVDGSGGREDRRQESMAMDTSFPRGKQRPET